MLKKVIIYKATLGRWTNTQMAVYEKLNLVDRNGQLIYEDDVIYDGEDYYRIYWNPRFPQVEAIGEGGYIHNLTQKDLSRFIRIGPFDDNEALMIFD